MGSPRVGGGYAAGAGGRAKGCFFFGSLAVVLTRQPTATIVKLAVLAVAIELVHATGGTYRSGYEHRKEERHQHTCV